MYHFAVDNIGILRGTSSGYFVDGASMPLDTNFSISTHIPYLFPDGSMLVGGTGGKYPSANNFQRRLYFMRIRPDGYVDSSFHHNTNFDVEKTMRYDATRLLLYGGWMTHYDSVPVNKICRIDTEGNLDTTFYSGIFFSGGPQPKYIQPDGKIIVGERFMIHNHPDTLGLIRLNPDGSLDSTFNNFNSIHGQSSVTTVCPTTDGGFLIGGFFTSYQGYPRNRIVKTDANGFIDLRYFNGEGIDSSKNWVNYPASVRNIIPAQNDKYYVMGHFLKYDGQVVRPLIRILGLSHTVGVEAATPPQVRVYPNPAAGDVRMEWELPPGSRNAEIRVRDIQGREVARQTVSTQEGQWLWDTREMPDGIYLYELRTEAKEVLAQGKIVVKK
ncbi:MAG: T9SS type A sorting domain-containing protein [Bacteroidia bacterium]